MSALPIPKGYAWLGKMGTLPLMIQKALPLVGTTEKPGAADNPTITGWAKELKLERIYTHDSIAWCGLFMAYISHVANKPLWGGAIAQPKEALWALNWAKLGQEAGQPSLGDVLVFSRTGGGHVGLYVAEDETAYHVLGGNQGNLATGQTKDTVGIARVAKNRLYAARTPTMAIGAPASRRPILLDTAGQPLSTNEA